MLKAKFKYEPETGKLFWATGPRKGLEAGSSSTKWYSKVNVNGTFYLVHRLVWFLYYGKWPVGVIDHLNGDKRDNRIGNLIDTTPQLNCTNMPVRSNNKSGHIGVFYLKDRNRWVSQVRLSGKTYTKILKTKKEAIKESVNKREELGFSPHHGRPLHKES